jgi:rod shape-determining protein MreC
VRNLFTYILKQYFFFLFLLLEVISLSFVLQNHFHRATFLNSTGKITGTVTAAINNISEYLILKKANDILADENARLRNQLTSSYLITDNQEFFSKDSIYRYISAKVISNSVNHQKNFLMLNKGSRHGIQKDMGVITSDGLVGTIVDVTPQFSRVMSVLHINNKINARIQKNNHLGTVEWPGKYYRNGMLIDIPMHVELFPGDTIVTSGNSLIFPEGIMVGTVEEYNIQPNEKFNTATLNFAVDYNSLYYVYVIVNLKKREQQWLEKMQSDDK